jgi:hypothetical protein
MSKVFRITGAASLQSMIDAIDRYEPSQKQLDDLERAMRLGPPKRTTSKWGEPYTPATLNTEQKATT